MNNINKKMYAVIFWYLINKLYHWPHNFLFTYRNHHPKPPICLYTASCLYTIIFWSWFQKSTVSFHINCMPHLNRSYFKIRQRRCKK